MSPLTAAGHILPREAPNAEENHKRAEFSLWVEYDFTHQELEAWDSNITSEVQREPDGPQGSLVRDAFLSLPSEMPCNSQWLIGKNVKQRVSCWGRREKSKWVSLASEVSSSKELPAPSRQGRMRCKRRNLKRLQEQGLKPLHCP